jgi:hypothetical protein
MKSFLLWTPLVALLGLVLGWRARSGTGFAVALAICTTAVAPWFVLAWMLRDGVGAAVASSGFDAVLQAMKIAWMPLLAWLLLLGVAFVLRGLGGARKRGQRRRL